MSKLRNKDDIEYHSKGFGSTIPAVNVKVYDSLANGFRKFVKYESPFDPEFTEEWIEENISEETLNREWEFACEQGWEELQELACDIYGDQKIEDRSGRHYRYRVYSTGRSGGWAYIDGINHDVDSWDAIEFSKWKRFAERARIIADHVMFSVVWSAYYNHFEIAKEEEHDRLLNQEPTDVAEVLHG